MAKKKETQEIRTKDNIYLVLNLLIAVVTMALSAVLVNYALANPFDAKVTSAFYGSTILTQVLFCILLFLVKDQFKDRLRALIVGITYIIGMTIAFLAYNYYLLFFLAAFFTFLAMAINQFMQISKAETKKGKITNILVGIALTLLAIATLIETSPEDAHVAPLLVVLAFLFISFKKILFPTLKLEKMRLLLDIMVKTHTIDVIVCLLAFMIAFSFILPRFESTITNFWDAMWYCFTVITTIGFGDFYATSMVGRMLTVVLGVYGLVVVAIITSVIVNFFNEVTSKDEPRDFIE